MIDSKKLADGYMAGARLLFMEDGEVEPIVAFHGGPTDLLVQLMPNEKFHPSDQAVAVCFSFATVIEATHVVAVNETWMKRFVVEEDKFSLERGDLERMHKAGDPAVHTALLVIVGDLRHHEDSVVATRDVEEAESEKWDTEELHLGSGSYLDRLLAAWDHGKKIVAESAPPPGSDWVVVAAMLAKMQAISSVTHIGAGEGIDEVIRRAKAGEN